MNDTFERNSAHHLRRLVDRTPSMLAYWDCDLRCRFANRAYEVWFGVDPNALVGTSLQDLLGPELFTLNEGYIRAALRGKEQSFERVVPGPNGTARDGLARYIPDIVDGEVLGFTVEVTDVSSLKRVESALRNKAAQNARVLTLLRKSNAALRESQRLGQIGSWEWEIEPDITTWSEELYRIFGRDPSRLPPTYAEHAALYAPSSWQQLSSAVERALTTGAPYSLELEFKRPDGSSGWIEGRGEVELDQSGRPVTLRGTALDITLRRQATEAQLQHDLAESASRNKSQLLSRVSHELRTPLNAVLGFAQLLQMDQGTSAKHRQWAEMIVSSGEHMLELVDEVLDLAGAERGNITLRPSPINLETEIPRVMAHFAGLAAAAEVVLSKATTQTLPLIVELDPKRFQQVLNTVLSNAIKYNRPGGVVSLSTNSDGVRVEVVIKDSGIGMSAAQLDRLFTPFDRLGAENTGVKGTGVGLALARTLVELMGGSIRVESQPGIGSTFTLAFPARPSPTL